MGLTTLDRPIAPQAVLTDAQTKQLPDRSDQTSINTLKNAARAPNPNNAQVPSRAGSSRSQRKIHAVTPILLPGLWVGSTPKSFVKRLFFFFFFLTPSFWPPPAFRFTHGKTYLTRAVSHCGLAIYITKYVKAKKKKNYGNSNIYFTMQK
jgi:hypothetical protein